MIVKSLLVLAGFLAAVYFGLIRSRGWHADHLPRRARRAHFMVCLAAAMVAAAAAVYLLRDELLCPAGYADPDPQHARMSSGKGGIKIVCFSGDGDTADGSVFAGLFALLGVAVLAFAGSSAIWRSFGPPAPPPAAPSPDLSGAPSDRRERRRERKRAQHRKRDG
ncbi:MAG TPA: hypothetical protein VK932_02365 [Kofleriaceae bacterium]|nr:hypothetical protein [Kofleriaceae bacterium]